MTTTHEAIDRAISDGKTEIQTFGGWLDLRRWAGRFHGPQPRSTGFTTINQLIDDYDPSQSTLFGPWRDPVILGGTAGRMAWPVR